MKLPNHITWIACVCSLLTAQSSFAGESHDHDHDHSAPAAPSERRTKLDTEALAHFLAAEKNRLPAQAPLSLPVLPAGVEEIRFDEFFKSPVGPRGLEPSEKLLAMNGKRVRILGYVGEIERTMKRDVIFAPLPLKPQPEEYGLADEIPAAHVLVTIPGNPAVQVPFQSGALLLTGTLSVGNSTADGETSFVRMLLDAPTEANITAK